MRGSPSTLAEPEKPGPGQSPGDVAEPVSRTKSVEPGEAVGLLGPSGCGKSTVARVAALLYRPDSGAPILDGEQPRLSADPRLRFADLIAEPLRANGRRDEAPDRVVELASTVGLTQDLMGRRLHEVGDGQLQRP